MNSLSKRLKRRVEGHIVKLRSPSNWSEMKVFAFGFNKTGTVSMHTLFKSWGLRSFHRVSWRPCDDVALLLEHQCFSDGPAKDFRFLDWLFPDARFILNVRALDDWVYSRPLHIDRQAAEDPNFVRWPTWDTTPYAVRSWIKERNTYHLNAMKYFAGRDNFMILNFPRDPEAANKLAAFLRIEGDFEKPLKNAHFKGERPAPHIYMFEQSVSELGLENAELENDLLCPSLLHPKDRSHWPLDSADLSAIARLTANAQ